MTSAYYLWIGSKAHQRSGCWQRLRQALLGLLFCAGLLGSSVPAAAFASATVFLADMTSPEVRAAQAAGKTTVIVPTGGTEQNGPHLPLGKHNIIVTETARRVAEALGNALVAPTIAYVPEGDITPPTGHMRFAGTLSVQEDTFAALLTDSAESLRQHGFQLIAFLGDSGGNQAGQQAVASRLNRQWARRHLSARVLAVTDYYAANRQTAWLQQQGFAPAVIGQHAGLRDTSELLALMPAQVRLAALPKTMTPADGFDGDPRRATPALGRALLALKVTAAVAQIRQGPPPVEDSWLERLWR